MAKASRKLLLALLTIAVCIALLVAGTYALFSADFPVTNHLAAGNLSATLVRDNLETVTLNAGGNLTSTTDGRDKDFTNASSENNNLFDLAEGVCVAPGCRFTADMVLTNTGTVAFSYWIEVVLKSEANAFAAQLTVSVTSADVTAKEPLAEGITLGSEGEGLGVVIVGSSARFSLSVEFSDLENNNDAQDQMVEFDMIVHAIQDATVTPSP